MSAFVSLLLMLVLSDAFLIHQNTVFNKISDGLTRSRWLISMVIELSPYTQFIAELHVISFCIFYQVFKQRCTEFQFLFC